jgi:hypothetical protein
MIHAADTPTSISIHIQGFFSSYKKSFTLHTLATLIIPESPPLLTFTPPIDDTIYYRFLQNFKFPDLTLESQNFITNIPLVKVIIPPFQTENHYDKRLLHHP